MTDSIVYYSTYTEIAYEINQTYYQQMHFAWCCPFFFNPTHPASSTPKEIYADLSRDVRTADRHSAKIRENISGILKGAKAKLKAGVISPEQFQQIKYRVTKGWQLADYKPVIFVIPANDEVKQLVKIVDMTDRAGFNSKEFRIEQLPRTLFDVISLED